MSTVLCVDDLRANRILFKRLFTRNGYEVVDCADAECAMKAVRGGKSAAAIILDLFLPRAADGFQALRNFKADPLVGMVPVIVVSSHADPKMCDEVRRLGAIDCISQPNDERVLKALRAIAPSQGGKTEVD